MVKAKRVVMKFTFDCEGSGMRSASCNLEHARLEFTRNGCRYHSYVKPTFNRGMFKTGKEYDISFILNPESRFTLEYAKLMA
jgi:hypothetical protein